jgi:hypothetical protein
VPVNDIQQSAMLHMNRYTTNGLGQLAISRVYRYDCEGNRPCENEALHVAEIRYGLHNEPETTDALHVGDM